MDRYYESIQSSCKGCFKFSLPIPCAFSVCWSSLHLKCLMAQATLTYKSHGTQRHEWGKRQTDCGGAFEAQSWNDLLYSWYSWDTVKRFRFTVIQTTCSHLMLSLWKNQNISFKNIWGRFAFQSYLWIYRRPDKMMLPEAFVGIYRVFFEKTFLF